MSTKRKTRCRPKAGEPRPTARVRTVGRISHGKRTVVLEVSDAGMPQGRELFRHRLCLDDAEDRRWFARESIKHIPNADKNSVQRVESLLAELAARGDEGDRGDTGDRAVGPPGEEVDSLSVARPELFFNPLVGGITVPVMVVGGEGITYQCRTYLRWEDGRREAQPLSERIALPGGGTLYLSPSPGTTPAAGRPGWSRGSREAWLAGHAGRRPRDVFSDLCGQIARYLDFPEADTDGAVATLALWVILTYVYPAWDAIPYMAVLGPMGSGKSRLLDVLKRLVFRPTTTSNLTGPALFRTLHSEGGTLLYDEAERLRSHAPDVAELLSVLLAGYRRGESVIRLVGDEHKTTKFDVYGPKAIAGIRGLPPTLASRCIPITMFRAAAGASATAERLDGDPERWQVLRDDLHTLALDHSARWPELARARDVVPAGLHNRNYELWQPVLALARWVERGGASGLHAAVAEHALRTVEATRDDTVPEADETILELLAGAVRRRHTPTSKELLEEAQRLDPVTFKLWMPGTVTRLLKTYGIPTPEKSHGLRRYRVAESTLRQIGERYGIDLGLDCSGEAGPRPLPPRGTAPAPPTRSRAEMRHPCPPELRPSGAGGHPG